MTTTLRFFLFATAFYFSAACTNSHGVDKKTDTTDSSTVGNRDTNADTNTNADAGVEVDSGADTDTDSDGDTDRIADTDTDRDSNSDKETDTSGMRDTVSDADTDTFGDSDGDSDTVTTNCSYTCVPQGRCAPLGGIFVQGFSCPEQTPVCCDLDTDQNTDPDSVTETDTGTDTDGRTDSDSTSETDDAIVLASYANNPIVQTLFTTDPAPLVYDGTVYLYTGHDEDVLIDDFFTTNDWRVYSTRDMLNWTDHGIVLRTSDFSWSKGDAWAGQVIHRNGKFYDYVTTTNSSGRMAIGVAVSDSPTGPFKDALDAPLISSDCGDIDPTVFIDDDGQAYLYWGNPKLCYVKLNDDMISYEGEVVHVDMTVESFGARDDTARPTSFEEGPWLYKRGDVYYMVFAAGPIPEHIAYATAPSATGPWTFGGVVMPTQGAAFTNHPGIIDYKGNSYFFYHNGALPGGSGYHRSVCFEKFSYNSDGTLPKLDMKKMGPSGVAVVNPYRINEAETIAWASGVKTEVCDAGGMNVTAVDDADYIRVAGVDFASGAISFEATTASAKAGGKIEIRIGNKTASPAGICDVPNTGGLQTWTKTSCPITDAAGVHDLYFIFTGEGDNLLNFDRWRFIAESENP